MRVFEATACLDLVVFCAQLVGPGFPSELATLWAPEIAEIALDKPACRPLKKEYGQMGARRGFLPESVLLLLLLLHRVRRRSEPKRKKEHDHPAFESCPSVSGKCVLVGVPAFDFLLSFYYIP